MRISDKQAHLLVGILYESCSISRSLGGITHNKRRELLEEILNQQEEELVELDPVLRRMNEIRRKQNDKEN